MDETTELQTESPTKRDIYFVGSYDPHRDPDADVQEAVKIAQRDNKRILLQVGGDWCGWCHRLSQFLAETNDVAELLSNHFVVLKINMSDDNTNEEFLSKYPEIGGYPHLFVLEQDGSLLHSQSTGELEAGEGYAAELVKDFLIAWRAPPQAD